MNNLLRFIGIFAFTCILFSCNNVLHRDIIKRHYNRGFYIANNSSEIKVNNSNRITASTLNVKKVKSDNTYKGLLLKESSENRANFEIKNSNQTNTRRKFDKNLLYPLKKLKSPSKILTDLQKKRNIDSKENKNIPAKAAEPGARSLFWIVALVLLILWVLGYLGGLDAFIYLLLIAALVIFFLWLFRII